MTGRWLVRTIAVVLLGCVGARGVHDAGASPMYFGLAAALAGCALLLEWTIPASGVVFSRWGSLIAVLACSCALALGCSPGLFLSSLIESAGVVLLVAIVGAAMSGPLRAMPARVAMVVFCGVVGAAWEAAAMPLIATLLI